MDDPDLEPREIDKLIAVLEGNTLTPDQVQRTLRPYLISKPALVNCNGDGGMTPLLAACHANRLDILEVLISVGADVRKGGLNHMGCETCPVLEACDALSPSMVQRLCDNGADLRACFDGDGWGGLSLFIRSVALRKQRVDKDMLELVAYLLQHGAPLTDQIDKGSHLPHELSALCKASNRGLPAIAELIYAHILASCPPEVREEQFHLVFKSGCLVYGRRFIQDGYTLEALDFSTCEPRALFLLLSLHSPGSVTQPPSLTDFRQAFDSALKAIDEAQGEEEWVCSTKDDEGRNIVMAAVATGLDPIISRVAGTCLLRLDDSQLHDFFTATCNRPVGDPLWAGIEKLLPDDWVQFKVITDYYDIPDFSQRTYDAWVRITRAAIRARNLGALTLRLRSMSDRVPQLTGELTTRYLDLVYMCLEEAIRVQSVEAIAVAMDMLHAVEVPSTWLRKSRRYPTLTLRPHGQATAPSVAHLLTRYGFEGGLSYILDQEPEVEAATIGPAYGDLFEEPLTPMQIAILRGDIKLVTALRDHGVGLASTTHNKHRTSLHLAALSGSVDLARLLKDAYPDPNLPDTELRTPLHLAALHSLADMVGYLVDERGASVDVQDEMHNTPADLAQTHAVRNMLYLNSWVIDANELCGPFIPIGGGNSAHAFRATCRGETVVVKEVDGPEARQTVRREIQLHSRLRDFNVVTFWGTTTGPNGHPALVLEGCEHGDLRQCLMPGGVGAAWSPRQRLRLLLGVAQGMKHVHLVGIAHHDLRTSNVFVSRAGNGKLKAKVGDFGYSSLQGVIEGGPFTYVGGEAPEPDPDKPGDVYRFGSMLLEAMVTPYRHITDGDYDATFADVLIHLFGDATRSPSASPLSALCWVSEPLTELIRGCRQPDIIRRPVFRDIVSHLTSLVDAAPDLLLI